MNVLHIFAGLAVVVPGIYMFTASTAQSTIKNKRVCLLIAHPDDEAMFFSPTVLALTRPENGNHVKILCLSTGDADGLGEVRKKELVKSGLALGLQSEDDVFVVDNPTDFPDSMTRMWDKNLIARLLGSTFAPKFGQERKNNMKPTANIDILITFDSNGVSSHPNHISLYLGARSFIQALTTASEWPSPVDLYTLSTVGIVRKYSAFMDFVPTLLSSIGVKDQDKERPESLVFMNQLVGRGAYGTAWSAMTQAHRSQMVWFRYGWITLSRYMVINDLRLEKVKPQ
ncbi:n-acetylglucosaminyl-phosphatidylinositol de-n-acetylase [Fusarium tjaetaba]|uniref:N-acetylglucosaminylphosphatidylinositol deacetylase n=1 Tax=Fusarium tjaetaba TaxID=1567544 RepID=A0A8H5W6G8_9HYPO|nr:n-acetylglucosaminyl-phosphatidylinositol de-n-acetylase [Fusarium tjaetaba]KAF5648691.1 n-acetylglucosaminyl-phosphatidylinositol de-n-acetylase [Fusarium tjaetaba]